MKLEYRGIDYSVGDAVAKACKVDDMFQDIADNATDSADNAAAVVGALIEMLTDKGILNSDEVLSLPCMDIFKLINEEPT